MVGLFGLAVIFIGILAGLGIYLSGHANAQTQVCTVEDKDRTRNADGDSDMRVYTDCGTFTVQDIITRGLFNSSDIYASLDVGETYEITTVGFRIPVASMFPNIVEVN